MIFNALTIGQLKTEIKDFPDEMRVYLDLDNGSECQGLLSIHHRKLYDNDGNYDGAEIDALVLGVA